MATTAHGRARGRSPAQVPLAPGDSLVPITNITALAAAGILYPATIPGWRALFPVRVARGLDHCFRRVGARIVVDTSAYKAAVRQGS